MALPPRARLGRGLSALLGQTASDAPPDASAAASESPTPPAAVPTAVVEPREGLRLLPVDRIDVNPNQPRRDFNPAALDELAASIKANGIIQPVIVRPIGDRFELVAGERRYRAARQAGLAEIPALLRDIDPFTQAQWALVENIHRADLNAIERAEAYATLMTQLALTQAELASRLGEQRSSIANHLRLLDLPQVARDAIRTGLLTFGHAKVLAGVEPPQRQAVLAESCVREQWSVRVLEQQVAQAESASSNASAAETLADPSLPHLQELEQHLAQHLGVRVQLRKGRKQGTGQIVLHYATLDQFDDLVKRWGIEQSGR